MTPSGIMIFAAGFGTRMGALTQTQPKPLIPVAGKALLDHALDLVAGHRGLKTVVNAHYLADQITAHLHGRDVSVSLETPDVLDTGGGLRQALPLLGAGPVFTMNSDMVWGGPNPLPVLEAAWDPTEMDALLLCVPMAQAVGRKPPGDFTLNNGGELRRGGDWVYTGVQILSPHLLEMVPDRVFSLNRVWNLAADQGRLRGVTYPGHWADVGYPEGIAMAERMLANV